MNYNSQIDELKGIGDKTKDLFAKLGVYTIGDILLYFPRDYTQYPKTEYINDLEYLAPGYHAIRARVSKTPTVKATRSMQITLLVLGDDGHKIQCVWYRMPYIKNQLIPGKYYVFYGKVIIKDKKYVMEQPVIYEEEKYENLEERYMPVYPLTAGITNNLVSKTVRQALDQDALLSEHLPESIRKRCLLCELNYAIKQLHFPDTMDSLIDARNRMVFDEFFTFILGMQYQKGRQQKEKNQFIFREVSFLDEWIEKLPYDLTNAQKKALSDIESDLQSPFVMQRLIQGDVGSGKTIVAFLAMALCARNGYQSAIMAPTEVLAQQHYESFTELCSFFGIDTEVILLTGSMTAKNKRIAYERIQSCSNAMIIGTHALIQEKVLYGELALVITDEQHRFGVKQRDTFSNKGPHPHVLVMSATPIPRTLAIIIYGDLDISVIDEVPARRLPIKNCVVGPDYRPKAYEFMKQEIAVGHQVYVICPLVEETENLDAENVEDYAAKLKEALGTDISVGVLHGKMKPDKKNKIMEAFSKNEVQVLVSTTVVEVGVNVPNATVMMIENADRFGLAQLHQLRGRVGRGDAQSYCIMINTSPSKNAGKRLDILNHSNDGFYIASEDLKLRGPGDFFGIRQSGDLAFQLADIYQDAKILQEASEEVKKLLDEDPDLEKAENSMLKNKMQLYMEDCVKKMNL